MLQIRIILAVFVGSILSFAATPSNAFTIDFVAEAAGNEGAGLPSFTFNNVDGSGITITATARDLTDSVGVSLPTDPFPYLDDLFNGNPGGLGVCQTTTCTGSTDDNIGFAAMGEVLVLEFDSTVSIQSVSFSNGVHLQNFIGNIGINVGAGNPTTAAAFSDIFVATGLILPNLTGTRFSFVAPASFTMTDSDDQQIYINSINFVPEPGTALLVGLGLMALGSRRRRGGIA